MGRRTTAKTPSRDLGKSIIAGALGKTVGNVAKLTQSAQPVKLQSQTKPATSAKTQNVVAASSYLTGGSPATGGTPYGAGPQARQQEAQKAQPQPEAARIWAEKAWTDKELEKASAQRAKERAAEAPTRTQPQAKTPPQPEPQPQTKTPSQPEPAPQPAKAPGHGSASMSVGSNILRQVFQALGKTAGNVAKLTQSAQPVKLQSQTKPATPAKTQNVVAASSYLTGESPATGGTPYGAGPQARQQEALKAPAEPRTRPQATQIWAEKKWLERESKKESGLRSAVQAGNALMETLEPKAPVTVTPSAYASGDAPTSGSPYAAGLQAQQSQTQTSAAQAESVGVDAKTREAHSDRVRQIIPRVVQLVGRPALLTEPEAEELREADRVLGQYLADVGRYIHYGDAEWSQIAPLVELKQAIGTRIQRPDAISTGLVGAVTAIPGVGGGLRWAYGKDRETAQGEPSQYDYLPANYNELDYARAEHPTAFLVGRGAGNLGAMLAGGSALRGSGALSALSPLGQSVAASGIMTGAAGANDALTDGAPVEQVLEQGVIGAFGGMAGGAASYGVGQVGNAALTSDAAKSAFGKGVKDSVIANAINHGVSGAAFTGANMGTKAILDPDYNPTVDEFLTDMGVSFVFGTVSSAIAMKARSEAAKARLDGDLNRTKELYARIAWKKTHGMETDEELLWELKQATQGLRDTLNNTQYVGYGKEVSSALSQLDWIDSQIWMAEQELGGNIIYTEPGSAGGSLALPFGAASDAERQQAVSEILTRVFDAQGAKQLAEASAVGEVAEKSGDAVEEFTGAVIGDTIKMDNGGTISMPNYEQAVTPVEKFIEYSLNYENKKAAGKAEAYERGLGYTKENAEDLIRQIHEVVTSGKAKAFQTETTQYGVKYKYRIAVTGPNGKTKNVIVVYQIDYGSETPRLITNYLEGK